MYRSKFYVSSFYSVGCTKFHLCWNVYTDAHVYVSCVSFYTFFLGGGGGGGGIVGLPQLGALQFLENVLNKIYTCILGVRGFLSGY